MKYYGIGMVLLGLTVSAVQADTWTVDDDGKAEVRNAGMPIQFNDIDTVPDQPFYMIEFE